LLLSPTKDLTQSLGVYLMIGGILTNGLLLISQSTAGLSNLSKNNFPWEDGFEERFLMDAMILGTDEAIEKVKDSV
jgi:hypothetical protein